MAEIPDPDVRREIQRFANILGGRVVGVIPRSQLTPGLIPWAEDERRSADKLFTAHRAARTAAEVSRKVAAREWLQRQRKMQRGWAILMRWMKDDARAAEAARARFGSDETGLLLGLQERGGRR
jgi:hypothetical protein